MRVLFVADLNFHAKGASRLKALRELGCEVEALSHTASGGGDGGPGLSPAFRVAWKLGVHLDTEHVNAAIIDAVSSGPFDLLWIEKGNMVRPRTLARVRRLSPATRIASYSEDDMFNSLNRTRAYAAGLKHYDVVFVTKSYNARADELPSLGARRCIMVDKAYDPDQHMPLEITADERAELGADVSFIGSYAPERGELFDFLASQGFGLRVWGNGWAPYHPQSLDVEVAGRALVNRPGELRYTKGIRAARISLGLLRKVNRDLQTDRSVEIPACGGFLLAERTDEHERLFEDGREAVFYDGFEDLAAKIRHYLEHEDERRAIAAAGRARCVESGYTHTERMRVMLTELAKIHL